MVSEEAVMVKPLVEPGTICLRAAPGETHALEVVIAKAPAGASVTASVVNGGSLVTLKQVVTFERIHRAATEEEIEELPRFPPSTRERFRRSGVEEHVDARSSDGRTPPTVAAGFLVQFHLEFSATQQQAPEVTAATLVIEGSTWERVEIPVFFLIGTATSVPTVEPAAIRRAAEPGEILTQDVVIADAPSAARAVAFAAKGGPIIRLQKLIALRPVKRNYTEGPAQSGARTSMGFTATALLCCVVREPGREARAELSA